MVRYTGKDGKEYVLRFDMSAMEEMGEIFQGGYTEAMAKMTSGNMDIVRKLFVIMANAGAEYLAEKDGAPAPEKTDGEGLLTKHSSMGRVKAMMTAIEEAIKDGTRMQTREDDDEEIRDGYLDEYRKMEQEKGKNAEPEA